MSILDHADPEVAAIIHREEQRQQDKLSMIASENFFSPAVRAAVGSVMSHKYSEGNIGQRYYQGNEHVDELEQLTIDRARQAFNLPADWDANVQALSGSNANLAVYLALLTPGDRILAMYLPDGGHLSHGWSFEPDAQKRAREANKPVYLGGSRKVHLTSKIFEVVQYKTDSTTRLFNYDQIEALANEYRPQLIITGGTAYPRNIDYHRIRSIADQVGAYYLADIAHEAGLIAAGVIPSPVGIADVVTMTTHKTLRAGRGAIILATRDRIAQINRALLPGLQGGPHNHNIAGICVGLGEVLKPAFRTYAQQILTNAHHLAEHLTQRGFSLVSGGTDKHLILLDLSQQNLKGRSLAYALDRAGIITNSSTIPQETGSPLNPSGLRLGTPWVTTRGMKEPEMAQIAAWIADVNTLTQPWANTDLTIFKSHVDQSPEIRHIAAGVKELCLKFPLPITTAEPALA